MKSVQQEVDRLVRTGFLNDRRLGTSRLVRSVQDSILTRPLTDLLAVTYGPLPVLTEQLRGVDGIEEAFIYGSWVARYSGEPGPLPQTWMSSWWEMLMSTRWMTVNWIRRWGCCCGLSTGCVDSVIGRSTRAPKGNAHHATSTPVPSNANSTSARPMRYITNGVNVCVVM